MTKSPDLLILMQDDNGAAEKVRALWQQRLRLRAQLEQAESEIIEVLVETGVMIVGPDRMVGTAARHVSVPFLQDWLRGT